MNEKQTRSRVENVLLLWYQCGDNFGDVLLYRTSRDFLSARGIKVHAYEVGSPCEEIFHEANKYDFLLFAGGGIIERYIPNVIRYFKDDYHLLKVPYGIIGFGIADFDYSEYREQISFWVSHASFFYVRDQMTKDRIDMLMGASEAVCSADCVFANEELDGWKACVDEEIKKGRTGINIRQLPYEDITGKLPLNEIIKICKELKIDVFIPDCEEDGMSSQLSGYVSEIIQFPKGMSRDEKIGLELDSIGRCEFVIAMRFHVVLTAAMLGAIPIPILYSPKVRALCEQLGILELAVNVDNLDEIPHKFRLAKEHKEEIKDRIKINIEIMRDRAKHMYEEIEHFFV